jgi:3-deoxy-D-manno-octulosonic-acid transferase
MLHTLYAGLTGLAAPVLRVMLLSRARTGKEDAARLGERRGIDATPRPAGRVLWLHAASVGESVSVLPVLAALPPEVFVLMTTGTLTSARMLAQRLAEMDLGRRVLHRFVPLDVPAWVARFLDHWRPDAAAFVESEIWPNLLAGCVVRGIPVALVNGRLSPASFAAWQRIPRTARRVFGAFTVLQAQSDAVAGRLRLLSGRDVRSPGNLKFATPPLPADEAELARLRVLLAGRPVWLAASTHPGEETIAAQVHAVVAAGHPGLLTIIVPRHPQRGAAVAGGITGVAVTRRGAGQDPPAPGGIWVADTLGELGLFYRLVGHAFVGRSLVRLGGQNPLEPARLGCAVAVGPHVFNFAEAVAVLEAAGGLTRVADGAALAAWVAAMIDDMPRRRAMGEAARLAASRSQSLPAEVAAMLTALLRPA